MLLTCNALCCMIVPGVNAYNFEIDLDIHLQHQETKQTYCCT